MRRAVLTAAAVVALAVPALAPASKPAPVPDRVQVTGSEYDLLLSRTKLKPGPAIVQFLNSGEDPHNLRLQRIDSSGAQIGPEFGAGEVEPGAYENVSAQLKRRATYVLWCSLADHRQRGMDATLRTRKHRR